MLDIVFMDIHLDARLGILQRNLLIRLVLQLRFEANKNRVPSLDVQNKVVVFLIECKNNRYEKHELAS